MSPVWICPECDGRKFKLVRDRCGLYCRVCDFRMEKQMTDDEEEQVGQAMVEDGWVGMFAKMIELGLSSGRVIRHDDGHIEVINTSSTSTGFSTIIFSNKPKSESVEEDEGSCDEDDWVDYD